MYIQIKTKKKIQMKFSIKKKNKFIFKKCMRHSLKRKNENTDS